MDGMGGHINTRINRDIYTHINRIGEWENGMDDINEGIGLVEE